MIFSEAFSPELNSMEKAKNVLLLYRSESVNIHSELMNIGYRYNDFSSDIKISIIILTGKFRCMESAIQSFMIIYA